MRLRIIPSLGSAACLLGMILSTESRTFAGDVEDAHRRHSQALNEYYRKLRDLGPEPTEAQREELRAKVVNPAGLKFGNAIAHAVSVQEKSIRQKIYDAIKSRLTEEAMPKWVERAVFGRGTPLTASATASTAASGVLQSPAEAGGPRKETVLDGKDVPKMIEFKSGAPKPAQTVEPGLHER